MSKQVWVPVAKLGRPKGLKGEIFSDTFNASSDLFESIERVGLAKEADSRHVKNTLLEDAYFNGKRWVLKLQGVDTIEQAQRLTHQVIFVLREDFEPLHEGEYYHVDLLGLAVQNEHGVELGSVTHVFSIADNDVLEFKKDEKLYTCALVKDFLVRISLEDGLVVVRQSGVIDAL